MQKKKWNSETNKKYTILIVGRQECDNDKENYCIFSVINGEDLQRLF